MDRDFYFGVLYPLQDRVLRVCGGQETEFYLTGGTAASRGYLNHRFSEDLDLFTNDEPRFALWADRLVRGLQQCSDWQVNVFLREERFARLEVAAPEAALKMELVNDVPSRVGELRRHPVLGRLDSPDNILANKLTALVDRGEPKDLADVWGLCCRLRLSIRTALTDAQSKAAGLFPADVARVLLNAERDDWQLVRWVDAPPTDAFLRELHALGEDLLLAKPNG
jgi:predicted nucleotidyltransferase component of viral defense system